MAAIEWDLDGDGAFDDATGDVALRGVHRAARRTAVGVRARDRDGGEDEMRLTLVPGNRAPSAAFTAAPAASGLGATLHGHGRGRGTAASRAWSGTSTTTAGSTTPRATWPSGPSRAAGTYRVCAPGHGRRRQLGDHVRRVTVPAAGARRQRRRGGRRRGRVLARRARWHAAPAPAGPALLDAVAGRAHGRDPHPARRAAAAC